VRIVAGSLRGRRIDVPEGEGVRPTGDRVRESVFNALESLGAVRGATVLDAFAGSGALGIEALSRGAASATFAEVDPGARAVVTANLEALGLAERARVVAGSATAALRAGGPFDLVLLDPPYAFEGWSELLEDVADRLAPRGVVVIESDREVALPAVLEGLRARRYGGTVVTFATPAGAPR
jgi:16S rRNA (guanine966-N2)-methyltransferase